MGEGAQGAQDGTGQGAEREGMWWGVTVRGDTDRRALEAALAAGGVAAEEAVAAVAGEGEGGAEWVEGEEYIEIVRIVERGKAPGFELRTYVTAERHERMYRAAMAALGVAVEAGDGLEGVGANARYMPKGAGDWFIM